jgi:hypothetical protein
MPKTFIQFVLLATLVTACAHRGAVRVDCEGPLRQINPPVSSREPPVTVEPADSSHPVDATSAEKRP